MTFGEKLKNARLALNLSQSELAEKTGISERSLYTYEQTGALPRSRNIQKIAEEARVVTTKIDVTGIMPGDGTGQQHIY